MTPTDDELHRAIATYLGIVMGDRYDAPLPDMPGPSWVDANWEPIPNAPNPTVENPLPDQAMEVSNADAGTTEQPR